MNIFEMLRRATPFYPVYDDGDDTGNSDTGGDGDDNGADDNKPNDTNKTFTQEDVNRIVQKEKAEAKRALQKRIDELQKFKDTARLTQSEKESLETQIGDMQKQIETKEEQARRERETQAKKHQRELQTVSEERDSWKNRYNHSIVQRELTDAAIATNAFNPEQVVALLRPNTDVVEVLDADGKATGTYKAQVKFDTVDDKGKPEQIIADPLTVVKRMLDEDRFMNLFKTEKTSGLGVRTTSNTKKKGVPTDTGEYIQQRREGKNKQTFRR